MTTDLILDKTTVESADDAAVSFVMDQILGKAHPVVADALFLVSSVHSYTLSKFNFLRPQNSEQNPKLLERLTKFSFVIAIEREGRETIYSITEMERNWLQLRLIAQDSQAFIHAHQMALDYHLANPDPDDFAQRQHILFHQLLVDYPTARDSFAETFRAYISDRRFAAIERLLFTAREVRPYMAAMQVPHLVEFDYWLKYVSIRFRQYRGEWEASQEELNQLLRQPDLPPQLIPYIKRAYGDALTRSGSYVEAIDQFTKALALYKVQPNSEIEQGYTMFALGEAHLSLATSARGYRELIPRRAQTVWQRLRDLLNYPPFPLLLFLSFYFGWWIWHPRSWAIFRDQDWIIARLFAMGASWFNQAKTLYQKIEFTPGLQSVSERLANLSLTLGDATRAEPELWDLLAREGLGQYRQATVQIALAQALIRLQRDEQAIPLLEQSIPIVRIYDDRENEARANGLMGEALFEMGKHADGLRYFDQALHLYQKAGDVVAATEIAERVYALGHDKRLSAKEREFATSSTATLSRRQFLVRFDHPVLRAFRRVMYMTLAAVLFVIPLLVINLDTAVTLTPSINFFAFPFLEAQLSTNTLNYGPSLSQAIVLVLKPSTDANVFTWVAAVGLIAFFLVYTILGLLVIIRTPLQAVQAATRTETVRFDLTGFTVGAEDSGRKINWHEINQFTRANVFLLGQMVWDHSVTVVESPSRRISVRGTAAWYGSLTRQIERYMPVAAKKDDLSYHVGWGRLALAYLASLILLIAFAVLVKIAPQLLYTYIPFTPYSFADLYPLFYMGLFLGPLFWGVLRPLKIEMRVKARNNLPWTVLGVTVVLGLVRFFIFRRPLLTIPDIYPPLFLIALAWTSARAIWQAKSVAGTPSFPLWPRRGAAFAAALIIALMFIQGGADVLARHFYIVGNWHRDQGLLLSGEARDAEFWRAVNQYDRAIILAPARAYPPMGLPTTKSMTWVQARNNRATLYAQLGDFAAAANDYEVILNNISRRHITPYAASQAVAYVSWAAQLLAEGREAEAMERYWQAQTAFDTAIAQEPEHSDFYVWRGVSDHNISGDLAAARENYNRALQWDATNVDALLGLGWVFFQEAENMRPEIAAASSDEGRTQLQNSAREKYRSALDYFAQASGYDPRDANIHLAVGYAYYALQQYEDALRSWEEAAALAPDDPVMIVSRGTGYWRVGTLPACSSSQATEEQKVRSAEYLSKALEDLDLALSLNPTDAFTYRTRAQIEFILSNCGSQGFDNINQLRQAVDSYSRAVALEPENDLYLIFRGRIGYLLARALFLQGPANDDEARQVLDQVLLDIQAAYAIDPTDDDPNKLNATWYNFVVGPTGDTAWPDFHVRRGTAALNAGNYAQAYSDLSYAAPLVTGNLDLPFQAGLAALAMGEMTDAAAFYDTGLERISLAQDTNGLTAALSALSDFVANNPDRDLAPFAVAFQNAPALQGNPDLQANGEYWYQRSRLGFALTRHLFAAGNDRVAQTALAGVIVDIEKAYAIAPTVNQNGIWRIFYNEGGWGWLHLRRGDARLAEGDLEGAWRDYGVAAAVIAADNEVTAADAAEAQQQYNRTTFALALQQLQAGNRQEAAALYEQGIALARERNDQAVVNEAIVNLRAAVRQTPTLAAAAEPLLTQLLNAFNPPDDDDDDS